MRVGWFLGVAMGIIGIVAHFKYLPYASEYNFWLLAIGFFIVCVSPNRP